MKSALTIATAIFCASVLLAPAAKACISCEYTPEVVGKSSSGHSGKSYASKRAIMASKAAAAQAAKKRIAAPASTPSLKPAKVAKSAPETTKVAEKTEEAPAVAESTTVATQASVESETSTAETTTAKTTTAPVETAQADVGCKKFIPAVGITVTVACE